MEEMLELIERTIDEVLIKGRPEVLSDAMRYAVGTGGKRIRPLICIGSAIAVGGKMEDAKYPAVAIELLHNYTLIHDDLPAMDNDIERRGKPTVWKKFGEANAILTGDALLSLAYQVAAMSPRRVKEIVEVLGAKGVGVVRGQVEDITQGEGADYDYIYEHKTADLFIAAAMMGGYAGGGSAEEVAQLERFALNLGLAFQYEDDLLDGDSPYSIEKTNSLVKSTTDAAISALSRLGGNTVFLQSLANKLIGRSK